MNVSSLAVNVMMSLAATASLTFLSPSTSTSLSPSTFSGDDYEDDASTLATKFDANLDDFAYAGFDSDAACPANGTNLGCYLPGNYRVLLVIFFLLSQGISVGRKKTYIHRYSNVLSVVRYVFISVGRSI